jgi:protein ImuB
MGGAGLGATKSGGAQKPAAAEAPLAFIALQASAERIAALNAAGFAAGLRPGQALAEARAIAPDLQCAPHDPKADAAALRRLALGAARYSPAVTAVTPDPARGVDGYGLYLDLEGAAHLFGGEAAWLTEVLRRLRDLGLDASGAVADTPGQAYGLSLFAPEARQGLVAPTGQGVALMRGLPVAALRLSPALQDGLRALGLKTVGAMSAASRASLARRFGPGLLAQLDAATGVGAEALHAVQPPPTAQARRALAQPLMTLEGLEEAASRLSHDLTAQLFRLGLGARRLVFTLYRVDQNALTLTCAAAAPTQDPARLTRLLKERLARAGEGLDLGFGVDALTLTAIKPQPLDARQTGGLTGETGGDAGDSLRLLQERLAARLGLQATVRVSPRASHWPERAQRFLPGDSATAPSWPQGPERPPFVLKRPEAVEALAPLPDGAPAQFRWRRVLHRVARAAGPERIGAEWWRADGPTRDYYCVETSEGRRLWVFREGLYGRETEVLSWFVHGLWP